MKRILQYLLAFLSRKIIKKYRPLIVGITGSVGKTSAKEAIFDVVSQKYRSRKSEKNFNNEFGLPFTVIGVNASGKNIFKWCWLLARAAILLSFKRPYPEMLVLEMGVDRPGDMGKLTRIAPPDVAVITAIGVSHYEFFRDIAAIEKEKGEIAKNLLPGQWLVVNADNELARRQGARTRARVISYGFKNAAGIALTDIREVPESFRTFFNAKTQKRRFAGSIGALGQTHLAAAACAVAVAEALGMETDDIKKGLAKYKPAPGRLNLILGIKQSLIIDDTYNSSPDSARAALDLLHKMPQHQKIAVLGDMLELGKLSEEAHREIGALAAALPMQTLVAVGAGGKIMAQAAADAGMGSDKILCFNSADQAKAAVQNIMQPHCVVLVKGSQGMRMEKITKEIMAHPENSKHLLCRQYGDWLTN